ncbi:MAG TPA: alpha/beta hydrolase [Thermomicrobiales bacterium]|nr:alpha/beta hydrolase [Thermomicrobiales bacterium]
MSALGDPADRQGQMVQVNGASIFVQQSGQGEPMLLIHGYPLSGALFSRVRDGLAAHYQVITIDQRGYGKSTAPGVPNTIATYAQDALSVLDQLGVKQAIIGGHSMGGPVTLDMYQRAPDRFRGMILIDTIAARASAIEAGFWNGFVAYVQQNGMDQMYYANLLKNMLTGKTRMEQPEQVTYLTEVMKAASKEAAIGGAQALATRPDATATLGKINVPTLVFVGLDDPLYPFEIAKMMNEAIPNSTLAIIPGGAHAAIFEVPDASTQAILNWASGMQ